MITNSDLTVYHKIFDENTRLEKWEKYYYEKVWWYGGKGSSLNKGYVEANDIQIRIPYRLNKNIDISNFAIGDILCKGNNEDIRSQADLQSSYNITSINNNNFGNEPHIHIGGK